MNNVAKFVISLVIPLTVGFVASYFTITGVGSWYQAISKPSWNPPNSVFGPVWTTLYAMMGVALFLVWKSNAISPIKNRAIGLFAAQLLLNFLWSFIFFNQHEIGFALADIILLWILIILTIIEFAKVSKPAAWLLVPYVAWVSFATILNFAIWRSN